MADAKQSSSAFDPIRQNSSPDAKIVASIDRIGQAFRVLLWDSLKDAPGGQALSPIQVQVLIFLLFHDERLARVGELAKEFMVTPATVSDTVSSLERKGLVKKIRSQQDRRSFILRLTPKGKRLAKNVADWTAPVEIALKDVSETEKKTLLSVLFRMIAQLQDQGVVQTTRMCLSCRHFGENAHPAGEKPHHCHLLDKQLAGAELRIDCTEHEPKDVGI